MGDTDERECVGGPADGQRVKLPPGKDEFLYFMAGDKPSLASYGNPPRKVEQVYKKYAVYRRDDPLKPWVMNFTGYSFHGSKPNNTQEQG